MKSQRIETDFLVIGGGVAGLYAALSAARFGSVALLAKSRLTVSNSAWAQGGIAAALEPGDSPRLHEEDTLRAGRGLCNRRAVEVLTQEGPECVRELLAWGVPFEREGNGLDLGQEGGHSRRRILHAGGGATGDAITATLARRVEKAASIRLYEDVIAVELISDRQQCYGALTCHGDSRDRLVFLARATILATGGLAGIYERTTNPPTTTGDGMALAYLAGAELADMEFVQFHPTALYLPGGGTLLISEALRGEGAYLLDAAGRRFLPGYHEMAELAPRDVVAAAIHQEMKRSGRECVFLSAKHLDPEMIRRRFCSIYKACLERGLDLTRDPIPVAPAAHYTIGGVRTDLEGRTSLAGLWASGEVACTGVNGANRLASNSLLECLVFSRRAAESAARVASAAPAQLAPLAAGRLLPLETSTTDFADLASLMTDHLGLVRSARGLARARKELQGLWERFGAQSVEWRNRLTLARLMVQAAGLREETRGVHRREDFPQEDPSWQKRIVLQRDRQPSCLPV